MDDNNITLQSYNEHVKDYVAGTPQVLDDEFEKWVDRSLKLIPKRGKVLEIGSGFGRDAIYIESLGYNVLRSDATPGFVKLLQEQGYEARHLNILTDQIDDKYDMVFAHAVFPHFKPRQLEDVLLKIHKCLKPGGVLAFSVKQGSGSEWTKIKIGAPRYFYYWSSSDDVQALVNKTGLTVVETTAYVSKYANWLLVIAKK